MVKNKIEVGSKWVSKVNHPQCASILTGYEVVVEEVTFKCIIYRHEGKLWYADPNLWHDNFKPYTEGKPMNEITVGSKWVAKGNRPQSAGILAGDVVTVSEVDATEIMYYKDEDDLPWYANPNLWYDNFKPYVEEDVQEDFTLGDNVNNPSHYGQGRIEAIEYISDFLTKEEYQGYLRGNIAKYLHRFPYKNGIEDLEKARWYLERLIEEVE